MFKKLLTTFTLIVALCLPFLSFSPAYAADNEAGALTENQKNDCRELFPGMKSWDCGLNVDEIKDESTLKSSIWIIVVNVITDIFVVAGYLLVGYIIYGGYMYMLSAGDANKVALGKKIITQAIVGIAIIALSYVIMNAIRIALLGNNGTFDNCLFENEGCTNVTTLAGNAINWVLGITGLVAVVFLIYGGITYMTSAGDANKVQKAKQAITYSIVGLAIIALSFAITNFVINAINDSANANLDAVLEEPHNDQIS